MTSSDYTVCQALSTVFGPIGITDALQAAHERGILESTVSARGKLRPVSQVRPAPARSRWLATGSPCDHAPRQR